MPSSFLVRLAAVSLVCALAVAADVKTLKSLVEECRFSINDYRFDLCPLFESAEALKQIITSQAVTPPTVTKIVYQLSLNGPLSRSEKLPDHEQCPDGTWFCMTTINRRTEPYESEDPRILQVVPIVFDAPDSSAASSEGFGVVAGLGKSDGKTHPTLLVRLTGGQYVNKPQRALLVFRCNHKSEEPTQPTYSWSWNGTHAFDWTTKYACGHARGADTAPGSPHDPGIPPGEDQDLIGTLPERHWITKHSLTTILLCAA
ncbi:hypothetical protein EWM64_g4692 [Hericium alpestre]|uniref:Uncharacterized protein n=1 Tax=Hericium alpestre TaxID=135208 RepID=A0A4Y9ZYP8_9AGAM|nr:hypothetical protein EWM64_g4692 [Hericium alpestre]